MTAVIGIIVVVLFWRFLILVAAEVFAAAGLPPAAATFQARSALTGSGYTTSESEIVVHDRPAREAASMLFVVGYIGPLTVLGLLGLGFLVPSAEDLEIRAAVLIGLLLFFGLLERAGLNRRISARPARYFARRIFKARVADEWMRVGDWAVAAVQVPPEARLVGLSIDQLELSSGVKVLAIERVGETGLHAIGDPQPDEVIRGRDELVVFGMADGIAELRAAVSPPRS